MVSVLPVVQVRLIVKSTEIFVTCQCEIYLTVRSLLLRLQNDTGLPVILENEILSDGFYQSCQAAADSINREELATPGSFILPLHRLALTSEDVFKIANRLAEYFTKECNLSVACYGKGFIV